MALVWQQQYVRSKYVCPAPARGYSLYPRLFCFLFEKMNVCKPGRRPCFPKPHPCAPQPTPKGVGSTQADPSVDSSKGNEYVSASCIILKFPKPGSQYYLGIRICTNVFNFATKPLVAMARNCSCLFQKPRVLLG